MFKSYVCLLSLLIFWIYQFLSDRWSLTEDSINMIVTLLHSWDLEKKNDNKVKTILFVQAIVGTSTG